MINKKVLFIAPRYFGYENDIISAIEEKGAQVYFVQENIDATELRFKILNKLPYKLRIRLIQNHFIKKFKEFHENKIIFDYIFCVRIDSFDVVILSQLKKLYPNAHYICYFWDSIKNLRNPKVITDFFDKIFTFDKNDSKQQGWSFCPLFYNNKYKQCLDYANQDIDVLFVASLLPERAVFYTKLKTICDKHKLRLYAYFTVNPYLLIANMQKYFNIPLSIIHFKGLSQIELVNLFSMSKVIMDCSSLSQSGLTMRTIECVGAKKKLITTNPAIKEYDFYNEDNILFIDDNSIDKNVVDFLSNGIYKELENDIYRYYSIDKWIERIFSKN